MRSGKGERGAGKHILVQRGIPGGYWRRGSTTIYHSNGSFLLPRSSFFSLYFVPRKGLGASPGENAIGTTPSFRNFFLLLLSFENRDMRAFPLKKTTFCLQRKFSLSAGTHIIERTIPPSPLSTTLLNLSPAHTRYLRLD